MEIKSDTVSTLWIGHCTISFLHRPIPLSNLLFCTPCLPSPPTANDAICKTVEGDPRSVLCEAVEKHHASGLVVGSHGTRAITRGALGSLSNYCAHRAHCSVMIVKRPKNEALNLLNKN